MISGACAAVPGDGDIVQIADRGDVVLRRLRDQAVGHAVLRIQPVGGLRLRASAEGNQQAVGDIQLRVAAFQRLGAVHVDLNSREIEELVNAEIHRAWHVAKLAEQVGGEGVVGDSGWDPRLECRWARASRSSKSG